MIYSKGFDLCIIKDDLTNNTSPIFSYLRKLLLLITENDQSDDEIESTSADVRQYSISNLFIGYLSSWLLSLQSGCFGTKNVSLIKMSEAFSGQNEGTFHSD